MKITIEATTEEVKALLQGNKDEQTTESIIQ